MLRCKELQPVNARRRDEQPVIMQELIARLILRLI
jgi:hypothetical protein